MERKERLIRMGPKQVAFIRRRLIPFILREHGRGFGMNSWRISRVKDEMVQVDRIPRRTPSCGTVACIGGSVEVLLGKPDSASNDKLIRRTLGLTQEQANVLFSGSWPRRFITRYVKAKTPYGKARVAAVLLEEVARTRGACLDPD